MTAETQNLLDLFERRIALLNSLAEALSGASASAVAFDIDGLESRIAQQESLCDEIRSLDAGLDRMQNRCARQASLGAASVSIPASAAAANELQRAASRLREAQARVKVLNESHQALLRRSRRTVNALLRSYHTFAMDVYSNPASGFASVPAVAGETV